MIKCFFEGIQGAVLMALMIITPFLRSWRTRWGATPEEVDAQLPGDECVPNPKWIYTRAITINAPADRVWPWVVQLGQGRGGFYSYQFLENSMGCEIQNTDKILSDYQEMAVGDGIRLHKDMPILPAVIVNPPNIMVLHGIIDPKSGAPMDEGEAKSLGIASTWQFILQDTGENKTRFITRGRYAYGKGVMSALMGGPVVLEPISFVMERKMMLEIKRLAE